MHSFIEINNLYIDFCPNAESLYFSFKIAITLVIFFSSSINSTIEFIKIEMGICEQVLYILLSLRLTIFEICFISLHF